MIYQNVVVGRPLTGTPMHLFSFSNEDWVLNEFKNTLWTNERYLPKILVDAGVVKNTSEVRRNRPDLNKTLNNPDFIEVRWGKKRVFILVGE